MGAINSHIWDEHLIRKYDLSGPRYTSYPTALNFDEAVGAHQWQENVAKSNATGKSLSLYVHVPFCDTVCYYCGCHKVITANKKVAAPYIRNLLSEIELQSEYISSDRLVKQIHWGSGTPTFLNDEYIATIMQSIQQHFTVADDHEGEYSIEIHPSSVDAKRIARLRKIGFNRLSLGVQDFDPAVQNAVNRFNSVVEVQRLMDAAHKANY